MLPQVAAVRHCIQKTTPQMVLSSFSPRPPLWDVSFLFCLNHSFLNPLPFLIHLFIPSGLLISLQPLFSSACPSLVLKQSFIHTSFCPLSYPRAKVHFDFFPPNSFHAPFSPCTFINSFFSPIASLSIFSSLALAPSFLAPRFLSIHSLKISSILLCLFKYLRHVLLSSRSLNSPFNPAFFALIIFARRLL